MQSLTQKAKNSRNFRKYFSPMCYRVMTHYRLHTVHTAVLLILIYPGMQGLRGLCCLKRDYTSPHPRFVQLAGSPHPAPTLRTARSRRGRAQRRAAGLAGRAGAGRRGGTARALVAQRLSGLDMCSARVSAKLNVMRSPSRRSGRRRKTISTANRARDAGEQ